MGIGAGVSILRLIHKQYYKPGLPIPIQGEAFRPTDNNEDCLSVFIDGQATPEQCLQVVAPEKRNGYYVARVPMAVLQRLKLTLIESPILEAPGHAVIPEMKSASYQKNKTVQKGWQRELAEAASADIVLYPPSA